MKKTFFPEKFENKSVMGMNDLTCYTSLNRLPLAVRCWRADNNPTVFVRDCSHCHRACHVLSVGAAAEKSADLKSALFVKKEISLWVILKRTHPSFEFWQFEQIHKQNCCISNFPEKATQRQLALGKMYLSCTRRKWPGAWVQPVLCRESRVVCVAAV